MESLRSLSDTLSRFSPFGSSEPSPKKGVHFAPERDSIDIPVIDDRLRKKYKETSCTSLLLTTLQVLIGIVIFPIGLYWLLAERE